MPRERDPLVLGRVIGDELDTFTTTIDLTVAYNNREVNNGCELRPSQIVNQPSVDIGGHDLRTFYTLVMVDPDAPSPRNPNLKEYLHWMVTDIPATTGTQFGNEVVCYESPMPTMGIHRFVFVLFQQLGRQAVLHRDGVKFSTLERSITLVHRWLQSTLTAKESAVQVAEGFPLESTSSKF